MRYWYFIFTVIILANLQAKLFGQNRKGSFVFETSVIMLMPIKAEYNLYHEKRFASDVYYNLIVHPKQSFGIKEAIGYNFCLSTFNKVKLYLPISASYSFIKEFNNQVGQYSDSEVNLYFDGIRETVNYYSLFSLTTGLNTTYTTFHNNELELEVLLSFNMNFTTRRVINETLSPNCKYCSQMNTNHKTHDFELLPLAHLCTPASIDSIVSSNGQEDHVSMAANAATKYFQVIENVEKLLAIELMNASQALEFRRPLKSSQQIEKVLTDFRKLIPFIKDDKVMYQEMEATLQFIKTLVI